MTELAIETHGLTKRFRAQTAVDGIDLAVPRGSVFGFLGPNGSGKTTTIRMLLGLVGATAGQARVLGGDMPRALHDVLPRVGALVEGPAFAPFLSGAANLRRFDAADRHAPPATRADRVAAALDRVGLAHAARKKAGAYSLGMKQRLGLANALLMPRDLLVLDEPTNGLDPQGTREVRSLIRSFAADGTTVFVSSHLLAEVEQLCTHVGVMSAGRLVAQGTLEEFRRSGESRVEVVTPDPGPARATLERLGLATDATGPAHDSDAASDALVTARFTHDDGIDGAPPADAIVAALVADGVRVRGFAVRRTSLEQRFVELTGEGFDVVA
ncbi:Daunorubicin/doxorubicin resistance ATP-binding protein DrrA [Agromyces sp. NDB4Y10]|uniref:ABC transporter ATP-binding protein n=1 Tax=Agromyces sp. NDB4Y10 TaxID=1775951 RepID=UPI0007B1C8E7|nr:ABC transporter ATP-binding protein [Agromyces sp. NDB4Y10]KZE93307.1 Daunorubicin/doxorubicin resistance ATP-binding protein DrrA [Agromyces sp. NDB4Y10]